MNEAKEALINKILLGIASTTGLFGMKLVDLDLILGIILKVISIISFALLIILNLDNLIKRIKEWIK